MTRPVVWSRSALDDLKGQLIRIAEDDPAAAQRVAQTLGSTAQALGGIPTGRPGHVAGTYEKLVSRLPYIIAYALPRSEGEPVAILRVIHTARHWPSGGWPED